MSLTLGSLFSGAGWLDLAIEEVFGTETVWVSDNDPGPCKVLAHRFPSARNLGDITKVDWSGVPEVDLIGGGTPCQDISGAGAMAGMVEGTRSNLWVEMREAIRVLRPMFVVWENVQAARSTKAASRYWPDHIDRCITHHLNVAKETRHAPTKARHRRAAHRLMESRARRVGVPYPKPPLRALGRVLGDLAHLGFDAEWISLPASGVGAPHKRLRYFIFAANTRGQSWLKRRFAAPGEAPLGRALGELAGRDRTPVALLPTPTVQDGANTAGPSQLDRNTPPLNAVVTLLPTPTVVERTNRSASPGAAIRPPLSGVIALLPTPRATDGTKGGPNQRGSSGDLMLPSAVMELLPTPMVGSTNPAAHFQISGQFRDAMSSAIDKMGTSWGPYEAAIRRWESVVGPAPTPTKPGRSGRPKLNADFALWMMGAPPGWVADVPGVTDNEALKIAGNGVVRQQAVAALRVLVSRFLADEETP